MMWHLLLQEAGGATPSHLDWGHERHPLATGILSPLQNQIAKPSRCVRALRALMSLNVPDEPQLEPPPTPMGPGLSYGEGCWSSGQPCLLGEHWPPYFYLGWTLALYLSRGWTWALYLSLGWTFTPCLSPGWTLAPCLSGRLPCM